MRSRKRSRILKHFWRRYADTHIRYVHNRMPVAAELANLLGIDIEQQISAMPVTGSRSEHVWNLQPTT